MEQEQFNKYITEYASNNQYGVSMIPAHMHNGSDSLRVDFSNLQNKTRFVLYRIVPSTDDTVVGNVIGGDFVMPFDGYVTEVGATVDTAGVTGTTTVDINKNGTTILRTKITIDSAEKTSRTAATPAVLNTVSSVNSFVTGDIFTFDVDTVNTTPAKGLVVFINVIQTIT